MKKSSIKKICACVLIIIVMAIFVVFVKSAESVPHFKFLEGKGTLTKLDLQENRNSREIEIYYYCTFEADYNDIYEKAKKELPEYDLINSENSTTDYGTRMCCWSNPDPNEITIVAIHENRVLKVNNGRSDLDRIWTEDMEGWVTVIFLKTEKQNWLIYNIYKLMDKFRNS